MNEDVQISGQQGCPEGARSLTWIRSSCWDAVRSDAALREPTNVSRKAAGHVWLGLGPHALQTLFPGSWRNLSKISANSARWRRRFWFSATSGTSWPLLAESSQGLSQINLYVRSLLIWPSCRRSSSPQTRGVRVERRSADIGTTRGKPRARVFKTTPVLRSSHEPRKISANSAIWRLPLLGRCCGPLLGFPLLS